MKPVSFLRSIILGCSLLFSFSSLADNDMERRLAACTQCHGDYGQGTQSAQIPRLAGKPAGYLYKQLLAFQTGQRHDAAMEYVVRQLSPEYLEKIAHYYAAQKIADKTYAMPEVSEEMLRRGEKLAKEGDPLHSVPACQACHGEKLTGIKPMIPGILGQPYDYIKTQLDLWRANDRSTQSTYCMWVVATRMQKNDVAAVSAWLATQKLPEDDSLIEIADLPEPLPGWCKVEPIGGNH